MSAVPDLVTPAKAGVAGVATAPRHPLPTTPAFAGVTAHWTDRVAQGALAAVALALVVFLALPLAAILLHSVQGHDDEFVGLANFIAYARTPALLASLWNSLWVSLVVTAIALPLAFGFAYALARSCMPAKPLLR